MDPYLLFDRQTVAASALALTDLARPGLSGAVFADLDGISNPTHTASVHDAETLGYRYGLTLVASDGHHEGPADRQFYPNSL